MHNAVISRALLGPISPTGANEGRGTEASICTMIRERSRTGLCAVLLFSSEDTTTGQFADVGRHLGDTLGIASWIVLDVHSTKHAGYLAYLTAKRAPGLGLQGQASIPL